MLIESGKKYMFFHLGCKRNLISFNGVVNGAAKLHLKLSLLCISPSA